MKAKILFIMIAFLLISTVVYADNAGCDAPMNFTIHNLTSDTQSIGFRDSSGREFTWDVSPGAKRKIDSTRCYQMHGRFYYYPANRSMFYPSHNQELVMYYVLDGQPTSVYTPSNIVQMREKSAYEKLTEVN